MEVQQIDLKDSENQIWKIMWMVVMIAIWHQINNINFGNEKINDLEKFWNWIISKDGNTSLDHRPAYKNNVDGLR